MAVYDRYYAALEDGSAQYLLPDPDYKWVHYKESERTAEALRERLAGLDAYWLSQINYVQSDQGKRTGLTFNAGPELSRLEDAQVLALYQELDTVFGPSEVAC